MPFAYSMTAADVHQFWRDFEASQEARQVAKRAARTTISKESPMVQKSLTDVAWQAVSAAAQALVDAKTFRTTSEAIDAMKAASHPAYMVYLASLSGSSTPPVTPAPGDVVKVVKQAQDVRFAKKRQVETEINKRLAPLMRTGLSQDEALREVFKRDPAIYEEYRKNSYADGSLPDVPHDAPSVAPAGPALVMAKRLALEMRRPENDPYDQYSGLSETEMLGKVWTANPALYEQNRQESYSRG